MREAADVHPRASASPEICGMQGDIFIVTILVPSEFPGSRPDRIRARLPQTE
jgi:hypothetical protein